MIGIATTLLVSSLSLAVPSDPAQGSGARQLQSLSWGVLVDAYAVDPASGASVALVRDLPVGPALAAGATLERSPATQRTKLYLPHPLGSSELEDALRVLDAGLIPVAGWGAGAGIPRDAVLVLELDGALKATELSGESIRLLEGDQVRAARVLADPLRSDRVLVDPTISDLELVRDSSAERSDLQGLSPSAETWLALSLGDRSARPPRVERIGPLPVLAGTVLDEAPRVLGVQPGAIVTIAPGAAGTFVLDFRFNTLACAQAPRPGDLLVDQGSAHMYEVAAAGSDPVGGLVSGVVVELVAGNPSTVARSRAFFGSPFDAAEGDEPACFLSFTPKSTAPPAAGVNPAALVGVRFTEAMATAKPYDGFALTRTAVPASPFDYVVGEVQPGADPTVLFFRPSLPLAHATGSEEAYFVVLGPELEDLSGNPLEPFPAASFTLDAGAPEAVSGGFVLRFESDDENGDGFPELRGQLNLSQATGTVTGRPVTRITRPVDSSQPVPSLMLPFAPGTQDPLNPLGARLVTVWRYFDLGFDATDEAFHNLDVERLYWSAPSVIADAFEEFEMSLAHSGRLPDETIGSLSLLPVYPVSGLDQGTFDGNVLQDPEAGLEVVHPRALGYAINPLDAVPRSGGGFFVPFPLNSDANPTNDVLYTWRDTSIQALGAPGGVGIDPQILVVAGQAGVAGQLAAAGNVPTIGLPLLMEFKCFPTSTALGLNSLDVALAINSSARPSFRAYSAGGFDSGGFPVIVNPDLEAVPSGGFNPTSFPPGAPTLPADNMFVFGGAQFLTRVSRAHTIWFPTGSGTAAFLEPQLEALLTELAPGTEVRLDFRGASRVSASAGGAPNVDAGVLDPYGDLPAPFGIPGDPAGKNAGIVFFPDASDATWSATLAELDGASWIQARLTFVGDPGSGAIPQVDALGIAFTE